MASKFSRYNSGKGSELQGSTPIVNKFLTVLTETSAMMVLRSLEYLGVLE